MTTNIRPNYQPSQDAVKSGFCAMAELEFVVDADGLVETKTARLLKTNNPTYAEAVTAILPQKRFTPAKLNGVPVRQIVLDKEAMQAVVVVMPAGQRPSSSTRPSRTTPSC